MKTKKPATRDGARRNICDRLERLTGGCITILYCPNDFLAKDETAKGHLYSGFLAAHMDNDVLDLDDRLDLSLERQIVQQIEAIASFYDDLARVVSDRLDLDSAFKVRERKKTVLLA